MRRRGCSYLQVDDSLTFSLKKRLELSEEEQEQKERCWEEQKDIRTYTSKRCLAFCFNNVRIVKFDQSRITYIFYII